MMHRFFVTDPSPELVPAPQGDGLRVLIVDGDAASATELSDALLGPGHQVVIASEGRSALRATYLQPPDVVLLGSELPAESRLAIERLTEQEASKRPFVIRLNRETATRNQDRSEEPGIDLHLTWPLNVSMLRSVLRRFQAVLMPERSI